jgi:hypothetical protein
VNLQTIERFNIPAQVPSKNEIRCICDGPEDLIHSMNGAWVWTKLPEDGDAADQKTGQVHKLKVADHLTEPDLIVKLKDKLLYLTCITLVRLQHT